MKPSFGKYSANVGTVMFTCMSLMFMWPLSILEYTQQTALEVEFFHAPPNENDLPRLLRVLLLER